jgi:hypothetical protein
VSSTASPSWRAKVGSVEGAAFAGLAHAGLFTASLILLRVTSPPVGADDQELTAFLTSPSDRRGQLIALNLVPMSVIALLWFIAVIRRRIGDREDKFFSSVFLGSGLLFAAMLLVGVSVNTASAMMVDQTGVIPAPSSYRLLHSVGRSLLAVQAPRLAAVFMITTSTLGRRTRVFPRWLVAVGLAGGVFLTLDYTFSQSVPYVFPAWVAVVSIVILVHQREMAAP